MNIFEFSSFIIQPKEFRIIKLGHTIDVEPQVFETLLLLIKHRNRVVTKEELFEKIWQGRVVSNHVITRIIYQLRKILDDKSEQNSHIRTVRGVGYQFIAEVKESRSVNEVATSLHSNETAFINNWNKIKWVAGLIVFVMVGLLYVNQQTTHKKSLNEGGKERISEKYPVVSLLPINVKEGNEELSILVQSLLDYLSNQLAVNLKVKVIHPDSIISLENENMDLSSIQKSTNSDFVIQGFIASKTDLKIDVHLNLYKKNESGEMVLFPLGAFEFPYPKNAKVLNDLYKQRKVTVRNIVKIIEPGVTVNNEGDFETDDPEAYRFVIAAHHMSRTDDCTDMQRAEELLLKAVERDEKFVYAYLELFSNYYKRVWICGESTDFHQKGLAMAEIIDRLAPDLYSAISIRRSTLLVESNQVEQAYELSKDVDLNDPNFIYDQSYSLRYAGFLTVTRKNIEKILQLDPYFFNQKPIKQAPNTLLYLNRFDEHLALLAEPGNSYHDYFRGLNLYLTDKIDLANKVLREVVIRTPNDLFGQFSQALLHVIDGDDVNANKVIDTIAKLRDNKKHSDGEMTYKLAQLYALTGDQAKALEFLQISVDQGFFPMNYFLVDPALKSIQDTAGFIHIVDQATKRHESFAKRFGLESEAIYDDQFLSVVHNSDTL